MSMANTENKREKSRKSKKAILVALLTRKSGATIDQIAHATGWQGLSVRAALSRLRQQGIDVLRDDLKGISRYRIAKVGEAA